jgi:hypothetical protein
MAIMVNMIAGGDLWTNVMTFHSQRLMKLW